MRYSCPVKYGTCRVPYKPNPYNRVTAQSRSAPYVPSSTTLGLAMKLIRSHLCRYIITQSRLVYVSHQTTTVQSGVYCIVGLHSDSSYRYRLEICNNILARFWKKKRLMFALCLRWSNALENTERPKHGRCHPWSRRPEQGKSELALRSAWLKVLPMFFGGKKVWRWNRNFILDPNNQWNQ